MSQLIRTTGVLLSTLLLACQVQAQALETGPAGVYAENQHGARTALGIIYNENQMVCAHKFHPSGSYLRVTRIDNNLSVVVQNIDRLSARADEVIKLSAAAAGFLRIAPDRIAIVQIEKVGEPAEQPQVYYNTSPRTVQAYETTTDSRVNVPQAYDPPPSATITIADRTPKLALPSLINPNPNIGPSAYETPPAATVLTPRSPTSSSYSTVPNSYEAPASRSGATPFTYTAPPRSNLSTTPQTPKLSLPSAFAGSSTITARGLASGAPTAYESTAGNPALRRASSDHPAQYYVQVAAFSNYANAEDHYQDLLRRGIDQANIFQAVKENGDLIYRTRIGPFDSAAAANNQKAFLARQHRLNGLVVKED